MQLGKLSKQETDARVKERARRAALRAKFKAEAPTLRAEFWAAPEDAWLSSAVTAAGISRSTEWLDLKAVEGGGIPYAKFGNRRLYKKSDVIAYLQKVAPRVSSTSEYAEAAA